MPATRKRIRSDAPQFSVSPSQQEEMLGDLAQMLPTPPLQGRVRIKRAGKQEESFAVLQRRMDRLSAEPEAGTKSDESRLHQRECRESIEKLSQYRLLLLQKAKIDAEIKKLQQSLTQGWELDEP